jgi:hypothetical protein
MPAHRAASTNGREPSAEERGSAPAELNQLRVTCRRQSSVIGTLGETIAVLRTWASSQKAENADLRAANQRMREGRASGSLADPPAEDPDAIGVRLLLDAKAPAAARAIVVAAADSD